MGVVCGVSPSIRSSSCLSLLASSGLNCRHSDGMYRTVLCSFLDTSSVENEKHGEYHLDANTLSENHEAVPNPS